MRALVCSAFGPLEGLQLRELPDPAPGRGEVLIDVRAAGVNFPDLLIVQGLYQFKPEPPFAPGAEVAGVVGAVGEGVERFRPGDRVMATMLWGGLAQKALAKESQTIAIGEDLDDAAAAALGVTYSTSHHALKDRARLRAGETLLVLGAAGGVGLAAVEIGAAMGATVIAAASSEEKLATARAHGAHHGIDYAREDLRARLKELTGARGVDVVYDPVGGALSEPALRAIAWEGRYLVVGFAAGEIPKLPLNLVLLKGCAVVGVFWGAFAQRAPERHLANLGELLRWSAEGQIRPHDDAVYDLEHAREALQRLARREVKGKLVIRMPGAG
jgi:NADPH2:quinone reductase